MSPRVTVVVVNWNRAGLLRACLASLERQTLRDHEVIVVDNGSRDGSPELVATEFPAATLVRNAANRGFAAANNQGMALARAPWVALLNNDAEADPRWLEELVAAGERRPGSGMVACKVLLWEDRSRIDKVGHLLWPDGQNRGRGSGETDRGQYDGEEEAAWPDGSAALYRREMLDEIGGFDEDFFAYAEDAELGLRARLAGWRCAFAPRARVHHRHGSTLGRFSAERLYYIERNRLWLAAKLFPWPLLLLNPWYTALRVGAGAAGAVLGRGEASRFVREGGGAALAAGFLRGVAAGIAGLPRMLGKRREAAALRRLSPSEVRALLRRYRIGLRELALRTQ